MTLFQIRLILLVLLALLTILTKILSVLAPRPHDEGGYPAGHLYRTGSLPGLSPDVLALSPKIRHSTGIDQQSRRRPGICGRNWDHVIRIERPDYDPGNLVMNRNISSLFFDMGIHGSAEPYAIGAPGGVGLTLSAISIGD